MLTGKEYFYSYFRSSIINLQTCEMVADIGTSKPFAKELAPYSASFHSYRAYTEQEANLYSLPFESESVPAIICLSVFEHLEQPIKAAKELHRVLKKNGSAFLTVPFMFASHPSTKYGDYLRYTRQGVESMFKDFKDVEIVPQGGSVWMRICMFPKLKKAFLNEVGQKIIKYLDSKYNSETTIGWMINLKK